MWPQDRVARPVHKSICETAAGAGGVWSTAEVDAENPVHGFWGRWAEAPAGRESN